MTSMVALCNCKQYLSAAVKVGKQALTKNHRSRVDTKPTTTIIASVDFDAATRTQFPRHARWDYLIEVKRANNSVITIAIEFHSVEFTRVDKKRRESLQILTTECNPTPKISEWILAPEGDTGGYALSVKRKLAQRGIQTAGRHLEL